MVKRFVTTRGEYLWNPETERYELVEREGYEYEGPWALAHNSWTPNIVRYVAYNDVSGYGSVIATNTAFTHTKDGTDFTFRFRVAIEEVGGDSSSNVDCRLYHRRDTGTGYGAWSVTPDTGLVAYVDTSTHVTDGTDATARTGYTGTFLTGEVCESNTNTRALDLDAGTYSEVEYVITIPNSGMADGYKLQFRVQDDTSVITNSGVSDITVSISDPADPRIERWRIREDTATSTESWLAAANTDYSYPFDGAGFIMRPRWAIEDNGGGGSTKLYQVRRRINGGTWATISTISTGVYIADSTHIAGSVTDNTARTGHTGTFDTGLIFDNPNTSANLLIPANEYDELEVAIGIDPANIGSGASEGDTVELTLFNQTDGELLPTDIADYVQVNFVASGSQTNLSLTHAGTGTASLALLKQFARAFSPSATGSSTLARLASIFRTFTPSATGSAALTRLASFLRTFPSTATGTASLLTQRVSMLTLSMTATGAAALSRLKTFARTFSPAAVGSASLNRVTTYLRTLTPAAVGTSSLTRTASFLRTLSSSATGTVTLARQAAYERLLSMTATGAAALTKARVTLLQLAMSATGTVSLARQLSLQRLFAMTAAGSAALTRLTTYVRSFAASATGTASLVRQAAYQRILTMTATGTATLNRVRVTLLSFAASAVGTAALVRQASFQRLQSMTATGTAALTRLQNYVRTFSSNAIGTPSVSLLKSLSRVLSYTATGIATLSRTAGDQIQIAINAFGTVALRREVRITLSSAAAGTAALRRQIALTYQYVATGAASLAKSSGDAIQAAMTALGSVVLRRQIAMTRSSTATGTADLFRGYFRTFAASAVGTALLTRGQQFSITLSSAALGTVDLLRRIGLIRSMTATGSSAPVVKQRGMRLGYTATGTLFLDTRFLKDLILAHSAFGTSGVQTQFIPGETPKHSFQVPLTDLAGNPRANMAGFQWAWFDAEPAVGVVPPDVGAGSTDASGNLSIALYDTTLDGGQTGYLLIINDARQWQGSYEVTL